MIKKEEKRAYERTCFQDIRSIMNRCRRYDSEGGGGAVLVVPKHMYYIDYENKHEGLKD